MREYQDRAAIAIVGLGLHFPGAHTPTPDEVLRYYVPLVVQLIDRYATR